MNCAQDRTRTAKQSRGCHISADRRLSNKYNLIRMKSKKADLYVDLCAQDRTRTYMPLSTRT